MRACMSGQSACDATCSAKESEPSGAVPSRHATNPPKRERQAEPEPWRAMRESSLGDAGSWYSFAREYTRAAKPDADEARPAAVGKLLCEQMWTFQCENCIGNEDCVCQDAR